MTQTNALISYPIGKKFDVPITRTEANFDRASDTAYQYALSLFGCNDDGYLTNVRDSVRSTDSIVVAFVSYQRSGGMTGQEHLYCFSIWVERYNEDQ